MSTALESAASPLDTSLVELVEAGAPIQEIGAFLDSLTPEQRWAQIDGTPRAMQPKLFELAAPAEPLTLEDFVPAHVPDLTPVMHRGWNTLPLPAPFRRFAKPMCRPSDGSERLFGYNEGITRPLIGPGYFVLHPTASQRAEWLERGAQVVDYWQIPDAPVAEGWPRVRPNWFGLQLFVYHQTRDFMRRVSQHVTVGRAFKWERPLSAWFLLVRED